MVEIGLAGQTLAVISVITTTMEPAQALAPVWPPLPLRLRSTSPLQLRVMLPIPLLVMELVRMEVMVEPLAAILVELAGTVMALELEVMLVLGMVVKPIPELEAMPTMEVVLGLGRVMTPRLPKVTVMVVMLLLAVTVGLLVVIMVETPTEVMEETPLAETGGMPMVGMAMVMVTQETPMMPGTIRML